MPPDPLKTIASPGPAFPCHRNAQPFWLRQDINLASLARTRRVRGAAMRKFRGLIFFSFVHFTLIQAASPAPASPLVTGNGFGFAVVSPDQAAVTQFYPRPYFSSSRPGQILGDGNVTPSLLSSLRWRDTGSANTAEYVDESNIIELRAETSRQFFFMPFSLPAPVLVASRVGGPANCLEPRWQLPVRRQRVKIVAGRRVKWVHFQSTRQSVVIVAKTRGTQLTGECLGGSSTFAVVALENDREADDQVRRVSRWLNDDEHLQSELREFEAWRKPPPSGATADEKKLWRLSETVLRMGQSREPNRPGRYGHGLIAAMLPVQGAAVAWMRDMAYAIMGLIRMGHEQEARWGIEAFFNARPTGQLQDRVRGFPYQISLVRYYGDGAERDEFWGGASDPNVEFDDWGLALTTLAQYVKAFDDWDLLRERGARGPMFEVAREFIVKPLLGNTDQLAPGAEIIANDTSIWEADPGSEQHFSYSTALAIRGLKDYMWLASKLGEPIAEIAARVTRLERGFRQAFVFDGVVHGTMEDNPVYNIDSAALETINFSVLTEPGDIRKTLASMEFLRMPSGGYRRITSPRQYDSQEFVFSDFNWARALHRSGRLAESDALIGSIVQRALADHGYIPEMYVSQINDEFPGELGASAGARPMVGYGAGMWAIFLAEREGGF